MNSHKVVATQLVAMVMREGYIIHLWNGHCEWFFLGVGWGVGVFKFLCFFQIYMVEHSKYMYAIIFALPILKKFLIQNSIN